MAFTQALESLSRTAEGWTFNVGDDWLQGRSCFGGLQSAIAVRAMRELLPDAPPLRTLQTTFIAPVLTGSPRVTASVLRAGKSAIHVEARIHNGDELACLVIAVFGAARPSQVRLELPAPKVAKTAEQARELPFIPGLTPNFLQHLRQRWADGGFPFSGAATAKTQVYVELRDEPVIREAHVIALADAIPSPALSLLRKPTPASSLTWSLEFLSEALEAPAAPWLMDAEVSAGGDGYLSQSAVLWSDRGQAIAISRQSVVVFG